MFIQNLVDELRTFNKVEIAEDALEDHPASNYCETTVPFHMKGG